MASSAVGNYRLEFNVTGYTSPTRQHVFGIWVMPLTAPAAGTPPADIDIQLLGGGSKNLQEVADQFCSFMRRFYQTSIAIETFSLYRYTSEYSRDFVTGGTAVPTVGGTGTTNVAAQQTLTFRTAGGNVLKIVLLEGNIGGNVIRTLEADAAGDVVEKLAAYIMSADGAAVGKDNTFPVSPLRDAREENEHWQGKIYRG